MKKLALLLCTAVLLMMACQKEEPTPNEVDEAHAAPAQNYPSTAREVLKGHQHYIVGLVTCCHPF